jgi:hypothetical protein
VAAVPLRLIGSRGRRLGRPAIPFRCLRKYALFEVLGRHWLHAAARVPPAAASSLVSASTLRHTHGTPTRTIARRLGAILDPQRNAGAFPVAAAWLAFMAGLVIGDDVEGATAVGIEGMVRLDPRPWEAMFAGLCGLSLAVGACMGLVNLAANRGIAEADPPLRDPLSQCCECYAQGSWIGCLLTAASMRTNNEMAAAHRRLHPARAARWLRCVERCLSVPQLPADVRREGRLVMNRDHPTQGVFGHE